jgi:MFS family permease
MQKPAQIGAPSAWSTFARDPATHAVVALGFTQIIAWGTTLYTLGVLGKPIAADTGWSQSLVFGGLTIALLVSSAVSTTIGRLLDRIGSRLVMSVGSILTAVGLVALAQVTHPYAYLAAWAFLGLAMRMTLYDAAFAALVQVTPTRGRRAISYLTLFGGFASTVFWPIGYALNASVGWRTTLLVFAAVNLLVCMPLHWFGLARRDQEGPAQAPAGAGAKPADPPLEGTARTIGMVLFGLIGATTAVVFGAMAVHLVPILEATGLALATAVLLASLKGFAQVAGRIWDLTLARKWHPISVGRVSIAHCCSGCRTASSPSCAVRYPWRCSAPRATARCWASWPRPTCCWPPCRRPPLPSSWSATAMVSARPSCWAPASSRSSPWK